MRSCFEYLTSGAVCGKRRSCVRSVIADLRSTMGSTRFDIDKFTGANDFALWKIKMEAILVQQGVEIALMPQEKLSATVTELEYKTLSAKARSTIILSLSDDH